MISFAVAGLTLPWWLPLVAALAITLVTSMIGLSGPFLLVPFQVSILGFASPAASATTLVFNLVAIPGGLYRYGREGRLYWPLALVIAAGGAPGTLAGAWLRTHWLAERAAFEPFAALVLLYLAWRLLAAWRVGSGVDGDKGAVQRVAKGAGQPTDQGTDKGADEAGIQEVVEGAIPDAGVSGLAGKRLCLRLAYADREYGIGVPSLLGFSFLVGVVGTAYGIGGGSFMVPLCLLVYRLPIHAIAGATLAATFITSAFALLAYGGLPAPPGVSTGPDWLLGLAFGGGGLVGAYLGARLQRYVPQRWLKGLLGLLLLGLALSYAWPAMASFLVSASWP